MGSWNGTCGISNLPILHGEEIVLFIIKKNQHARNGEGGYVYCNDQYEPFTFPIHGHYNDYGGIEAVSKNGEIAFKHFIDKMIPAIGDKKGQAPSDIEELVNDYIERGEYENIGFMMVRKDIWDAMINDPGMKVEYEKTKQAAQSFIDSFKVKWNDLKTEYPEDEDINEFNTATYRLLNPFSFSSQYGRNNFLDWIDNYTYGLNRFKGFLTKLPFQQNDDMKIALVDLITMTRILSDLRKGWMIQAGAGSQNEDVDLHKALAIAVLKSTVRSEHKHLMYELSDDELELVEEKLQDVQEAIDDALQLSTEVRKTIEKILEIEVE